MGFAHLGDDGRNGNLNRNVDRRAALVRASGLVLVVIDLPDRGISLRRAGRIDVTRLGWLGLRGFRIGWKSNVLALVARIVDLLLIDALARLKRIGDGKLLP